MTATFRPTRSTTLELTPNGRELYRSLIPRLGGLNLDFVRDDDGFSYIAYA